MSTDPPLGIQTDKSEPKLTFPAASNASMAELALNVSSFDPFDVEIDPVELANLTLDAGKLAKKPSIRICDTLRAPVDPNVSVPVLCNVESSEFVIWYGELGLPPNSISHESVLHASERSPSPVIFPAVSIDAARMSSDAPEAMEMLLSDEDVKPPAALPVESVTIVREPEPTNPRTAGTEE